MKRQLERVEIYIEEGARRGADLVTGGRRPGAPQHAATIIEPTLFANVDNQSRIAQEEIFGPVLSLIPCEDEEDAIRIANDSDLRPQRLGADHRRRTPPGGIAAGIRTGVHRPERHAHGFLHAVRRLQAVGHRPRGRRGRAVALRRDQDDPARRGAGAVVR